MVNTSKDPVVGNEQKAGAFWQRIAAYFAASPKVARGETRSVIQCKQRWQKMKDLVSKFCGTYAAATRQRTSGQSEDDTRKCDDGAQSESSQATSNLGDEPTNRPPGVKAAKRASGKRSIADHLSASEFQTMWSIKERDLAAKERLSKMSLLDRLIAKKDSLTEYEEALNNKLISDMLG
ncbi:uncharacterized protein LOC108834094 [Raphanus sativus]|uniref:Uncharacterized protein LOC108834094 n=1 Tax=Raphanus sativus TaxID=3726 RepID=A0A6J0LSV9_RAPSA|nr:uncharacterized protein LOC108834094 [Raphanus sativus]